MTLTTLQRSVFAAIGFGFASSAVAAPFPIFDPRTLGMGGVGVASGDMTNASFLNPALLAAARDEDDFTLILPTVAVQARDPNDIADGFDDFEASVNALDAALNTFDLSPTPGNAGAVATAGQQALNSFVGLGNRPLQFSGAAGVVLGIPSKKLGISAFASAAGSGGAVLTVSPNDTNGAIPGSMQNIIDLAGLCAGGSAPDCTTLAGITTVNVASTVDIRGALIRETGVSLATNIQSLGGLAIGVTPKLVRVDTFDYAVGADTVDISIDTGRKTHDTTNFDVGIVKELDENWRLGFVVRNLIGKEYDTVLGNKIKVDPAMRAGISGRYKWGTLAADLDVSENDPSGLDSKTQYAAVGAELDLKYMLVRLGMRHNLAAEGAEEATSYAFGLGFWLGFHLDLAVAGNEDEVAAALQLGFSF